MPKRQAIHRLSRRPVKSEEETVKTMDEKLQRYQPETANEKSSTLIPLRLKKPLVILFLAAFILAALGYLLKDKFVAATINGKPVFRYQLSQRLTSVFGKETLENMIVEALIGEEAKKEGVVVTNDEVNQEIKKVSQSLGEGMKLEDALSLQGVSLGEFKKQLKLRLQVNRLLEKEILISPEEVDKYLKDNAKTLVATQEAERRREAEGKIKEQKIGEGVQKWVSDLLAKAKIIRFLK